MTGFPSENHIADADCGSCDARELAPVVWHRKFVDAEEQAASMAGSYVQQYDQLDAGAFTGTTTRVDLDGVIVFRERVNRCLFQAGTAKGFSLVWPASPTARCCCNGVDLGPERMVVWHRDTPFEIFCDPSEIWSVAISSAAFADWSGYCPDDGDQSLLLGIRIVPPRIADSLRFVMRQVVGPADAPADLGEPALLRATLRDELLQLVTTVAELPGSRDESLRRCERTYQRVVGAARAYIAAQGTGSVTIEDLCKRVGVSRRNLHYAFDALLGMSPGRYLRSVRLNAVRRSIKRAGPGGSTVADIAFSCGFCHPSHFTADYKRHFEELPSETARRAASVGAMHKIHRPVEA
jgi:AraC family transcriptional regulator, ethanolamine operon transcriptional activator